MATVQEILAQMPRHVPPEALSAVAESSDLETMRAVFGPLTSYLTVELARDILQHTGGTTRTRTRTCDCT
jgi:hypothetical protein